jgi:hypothetical protein
MIFDGRGNPATLFPRDSARAAWCMLSWNHNVGLDAIKERYLSLGYECWQVEIVKRNKVRTRRKAVAP